MAWVRLEDDFYDNDKFEYVGPLGVALYVAALAYCNRNLTDGVIPRSKLRSLLDFEGIAIETAESSFEVNATPLVIQTMLDTGLLHEAGHDCEACPQPDLRKYVIHDYLRYQPSRERVERERKGSRERMAKSRRNRGEGSEDVAAQQGSNDEGSSPAPNPNPKPEGSKEPSGGAPRQRGTRLPDIFPITEAMRDWGREHAPDVDAAREHEKFRDYWRSVSGQKGVKRDWTATWRVWMRKAQEDAERRRPPAPTPRKPEDNPFNLPESWLEA